MAMVLLATEQNANPVMPASAEWIWGVVSILFVVMALVVVGLVARYLIGLQMTAKAAAEKPAAAEAEIHALREELLGNR